MILKTILVHVDLSRHAPARIRAAAALANAHGACLLGVAMTGIPRAIFPEGYDVQPDTLAAGYFEPLVDNARRALAAFELIAKETGTAFETRLVCDAADDALALMARFADLVVESQNDLDEAMTDMALQLPDNLIMKSARPVLIIPRTDPVLNLVPTALVAWDGSEEASFAVSAAVPLLQRARAVTVVTLLDAGRSRADSDREQAELGAYLGRHAIKPAFMTVPVSGDPGGELLKLAGRHGHDLLVMGCYGHARWRELCLGGASRTVLAETDIPVLLAH